MASGGASIVPANKSKLSKCLPLHLIMSSFTLVDSAYTDVSSSKFHLHPDQIKYLIREGARTYSHPSSGQLHGNLYKLFDEMGQENVFFIQQIDPEREDRFRTEWWPPQRNRLRFETKHWDHGTKIRFKKGKSYVWVRDPNKNKQRRKFYMSTSSKKVLDNKYAVYSVVCDHFASEDKAFSFRIYKLIYYYKQYGFKLIQYSKDCWGRVNLGKTLPAPSAMEGDARTSARMSTGIFNTRLAGQDGNPEDEYTMSERGSMRSGRFSRGAGAGSIRGSGRMGSGRVDALAMDRAGGSLPRQSRGSGNYAMAGTSTGPAMMETIDVSEDFGLGAPGGLPPVGPVGGAADMDDHMMMPTAEDTAGFNVDDFLQVDTAEDDWMKNTPGSFTSGSRMDSTQSDWEKRADQFVSFTSNPDEIDEYFNRLHKGTEESESSDCAAGDDDADDAAGSTSSDDEAMTDDDSDDEEEEEE